MVVGEFFVSKDGSVDRETLFQVMSISKWVTAWVVLTLVESGDLELDAPITDHLTDWRLPESQYDASGVTVRRLLSHTAGVNHGDFEGFLPDQEMQSLVDFMTKPADGGAHGNVRLDQFEPGTSMRYSNNGYALLQHVVEQITGESFEDYAWRAVLQPLEMAGSTFDTEAAKARALTDFYDTSGEVSVHRRYGAVAPSSLYTSTADLARFLLAHVPGDSGETAGRGVLSMPTIQAMQENQTPEGSDAWGLGVDLHGEGTEYTIGHNGSHFSDPSIVNSPQLCRG
jgi:CubicO group peptidase (beta-lactamase class C family)